MTPLEIEKALANIVTERCGVCRGKLDSISTDAKIERKAIEIELGMYGLCLRAGLLYNTSDDRDRCIDIKCTRMPNILAKYLDLMEKFAGASREEQLMMTAALYGEIFMHDQFLYPYMDELSKAEATNDIETIFEFRIKIGAIREVLKEWSAWRKENNIYSDMLEEVCYG